MGKYVAFAVLVLAAGVVIFRGGDSDFSIKDSTLPTEQMSESLLFNTISHGERVEIEDNLVAGRWTVVEFTADW